jgi:RNA polymerase sigma-70 factor (ECF subfamily)
LGLPHWNAVAVAMAEGVAQGLALLDRLASEPLLHDYYLYHAARADLLRRAGQNHAAAESYRRALALCQNAAERAFLQRQLEQLA